MSSNNKKPVPPGNVHTPPTSNLGPSRSPSRMTTPTTTKPGPGAASTNTSSVARSRSVRGATPVSARVAARKTAESGTGAEDIKAEMQVKLDELQQQLVLAEKAAQDAQKQASVLQAKLEDSLKEQGILEESVHEQSEKLEELENARKESERGKRELEQIYESEQAAAMKEMEATQAKHDEMEAAIHRMKESLAQREMRAAVDDDRRPSPTRGSSFRSGSSPGTDRDGQFAPSSALQRSDSRNNSKLIIQKDKIIESLRMEVAEFQIRLVEMESMGGGQLQEIQKQLYETKVANARLLEENESFTLLLRDKTLNGDFGQSDLLRPPSPSGSRPSSRPPEGASLADELASEDDAESTISPQERKLQAEANGLRDQNKALTLYINNIISRLLQHEQFEQILDKSPDLMAGPNASIRRQVGDGEMLPPPPPPKDSEGGLLQRAKSVISGKPMRPSSFIGTGDQVAPTSNPMPRPTESIATAPSIPIGRSNSTRGGHRRTNSEWSPASVVTSMYRGPSPSLQGATSPGLGSPNGSKPFFSTFGPALDANKENSTQRDSKVSKRNSLQSNRTSIQSNPGLNPADLPESSENSNPSSPPRSTTSSGDKETRAAPAIMMGSKMRPLRLVQETQEDEAAKKAANRSSWFGWMNKGTPPPTSGGVRNPSGLSGA